MSEQDAENKLKNYRPTAELRWNTVEVNPNGATATIPWLGDPHYARVLQQKWVSDFTNEFPVWRNVPEFFKAETYVPGG